jgi:EAL domain-containing protein (putative c-di-GMP-specific phosphodiesterase class I)
LNERLLLLLTFNGMVVTTGLVLVTVVGERARAMHALRQGKQGHVAPAHDPLTGLPNETLSRHQRAAQTVQPRGASSTSETISEVAAEKLLLEKRLRRAIENDEFVLVYQPIVDVVTRRVSGVEALMRWKSPDAGLVSPRHFIPLLEDTGLILDVGRWALKQAVRDQAAWTAEGVSTPRIAVNVSPIQLRHLHFVEHVQEATARTHGTPLIDLEITESHLMEDLVPSIAKLTKIRAMGMGVAIDDFGTGYSSLAYLTRLPVNVLKVDQAFISSMLEDDNAMTMVHAILSVAASLKLRTVAEGVESEGQADMLALLGCDEMQGYLISRPVSRAEITRLLQPSS